MYSIERSSVGQTFCSASQSAETLGIDAVYALLQRKREERPRSYVENVTLTAGELKMLRVPIDINVTTIATVRICFFTIVVRVWLVQVYVFAT